MEKLHQFLKKNQCSEIELRDVFPRLTKYDTDYISLDLLKSFLHREFDVALTTGVGSLEIRNDRVVN